MLVMLLWFCSSYFAVPAQQGYVKNENDSAIFLADPTIFHHQGVYYLYGTVEGKADNGFIAYASTDLKTWERSGVAPDGYVLRRGDAYGTAGFWAPQVLKYQDSFYMAYVANENIAIAKSNSPSGPFAQGVKQPIAAPVKQIDPFIFIDDDGKKYLYHVRLTGGNKIFVAELTDDFSALKEETLQECIIATEPWENTANAAWPVTEGPTVLKHHNRYYLFYSANDFRNPDYAVGYAVSNTPYGPWKKADANPILYRKHLGINGTGHGDFIIGQGERLFYVFHTHYSDSTVAPRRTAIIEAHFLKNHNATDVRNIQMMPKRFYFLTVRNKKIKSMN